MCCIAHTPTEEQKQQASTADNFVQIYLISLEIKHASDLVKADRLGKSDPYCKVSAFGQTYTTKTVLKNLNPQWHEKTQFCFFDDPKQLKFEVWDWDKGTKDDAIGEAYLPVSNLFNAGSKRIILYILFLTRMTYIYLT